MSEWFDIPPERDRTDEDRADIQRAWELIGDSRQLLNSTDGHLAVLRAIRFGRWLERQTSEKAGYGKFWEEGT